jgi:hypothetical protein
MKTIFLHQPKGLPKCAVLRVTRTVQPDVRLDQRQWVIHHRRKNHVHISL